MSEVARTSAELERRRSFGEHAAAALLLLCGAATLLTSLGIVAALVGESIPFFRAVSPARLVADAEWTPFFTAQRFGLGPLVAGTALTAGLALLVAVPLGVLAAIYLSEFAPARVRRVVKPALEVLAGIPAVAWGLFALTFVTPALQRVVPGLEALNALSPGLVMGVMILPVIASLAEDALYAVPHSLREGALALGASRVTTAFRVVLPQAASGVVAAALLGMARAIGETMVVAMAAGQSPRLALDPRGPVETLSTFMAQVSLGETAGGSFEVHTLYAVGLVLFASSLGLNLVAQRLRRGDGARS